MAKQLTTASISAPGFFGLNTQEASVTLAEGFALTADNLIIDRYGRLGSRKGWEYVSDPVANAGVNLSGGHEFIDIDGTRYVGVWSQDNFYIASGDTLTPVTYRGSNVITTDGWQAATLNDAAFLFNRLYEPIYFNPVTGILDDVHEVPVSESFTITSAGTVATVNLVGHNFTTSTVITITGANESEYNGTFTVASVVDPDNFTYTLPNSATSPATGTIVLTWERFVPQGNTVLSAYGRLWVGDTPTNKTTVYWSNLLDGQNFASGSAGSLDISSVLVRGNDEIVALGAQAGRLIIFCKNNIIIYSDTDSDTALDPTTMKLVEVIHGVGCVARDSIQNTGSDILFLSEDGLKSLGRLIQEKSQPMRDISKNIRDDLVSSLIAEDPSLIRSVYSPREAFYLLYLPTLERIYCFDTRSYLQDGSARVTRWDQQTHTNMFIADDELYFTQVNGLAKYSTYTDNGATYFIRYHTNHMDFGDSTTTKYLKRLSATVVGGTTQEIVFKSGFDFLGLSYQFSIPLAPSYTTEYNVDEYGVFTSQYNVSVAAETLRVPIGGGGNIIQAGFEAEISGYPISIQRLDIYVKQGRIY